MRLGGGSEGSPLSVFFSSSGFLYEYRWGIGKNGKRTVGDVNDYRDLPLGAFPLACGECRWTALRQLQRPLQQEFSCSYCPGDDRACAWAVGRSGYLRSQDQRETRVSTALAVWGAERS